MTRAKETSEFKSLLTLMVLLVLMSLHMFPSVKLIDSNLTLNAGSSDALITVQKTHLRVDTGATLDIADDRHLVINHYNYQPSSK